MAHWLLWPNVPSLTLIIRRDMADKLARWVALHYPAGRGGRGSCPFWDRRDKPSSGPRKHTARRVFPDGRRGKGFQSAHLPGSLHPLRFESMAHGRDQNHHARSPDHDTSIENLMHSPSRSNPSAHWHSSGAPALFAGGLAWEACWPHSRPPTTGRLDRKSTRLNSS